MILRRILRYKDLFLNFMIASIIGGVIGGTIVLMSSKHR